MKKILFIGQLTDNSGYGNAARSYVSTLSKLDECGAIELRLLNHSFETNSSLKEEEKEVIKKYSLVDHGNFTGEEKLNYFTEDNKRKIQKYLDDNKGEFYVISLLVPDLYDAANNLDNMAFEWVSNGALLGKQSINMEYVLKYSAGLYPCFVWEFDNLPKAWAESIKTVNKNIVKFISACSWNKEVIEGCTNKESVVIPYMVKGKIEQDKEYTKKLKGATGDKYTFCMVGQLQPRKGFDILVKAFLSEFKDDDVNLLMKCYTNEVFVKDSKTTIEKARKLILSTKGMITSYGAAVKDYKCNIAIIPGVISENKLSSIYEVSDCFVTCTRGEGFGIPLADFLIHYKKPVISPDKGGHLDFVESSSPFIESRFEPYFSIKSKHHATCDMNYIEPSILSARKQMRKMYEIGKNTDKYNQICDTMHKHAKEYLDPKHNVQMFKDLLGV